MIVDLGDPIRLRLQLFDGATGLFPRAVIYNEAGAPVAGSPFALTHLAGGLYQSDAFVPGVVGQYDASFTVYTDAGFITESSLYARALEVFDVRAAAAALDPAQVASAVWDAQTSAHVVAGSFGLNAQTAGPASSGGGCAGELVYAVVSDDTITAVVTDDC